MRDVLPYIFWPWLLVSCSILVHRRFTAGTWRFSQPEEPMTPISMDLLHPPEPDQEPTSSPVPPAPRAMPQDGTVVTRPAVEEPEVSQRVEDERPAVAQRDPNRPAALTLADAVSGIAMPCYLAPLIGDGAMNPRKVAFYTTGFEAATVGKRVGDELERLGFDLSSVDDRTIRAEHGPDSVQAKMRSLALDNPEVMEELHPSAPEGAVVLELSLI